jgi:type II secretory pathway pseudopilin PulG
VPQAIALLQQQQLQQQLMVQQQAMLAQQQQQQAIAQQAAAAAAAAVVPVNPNAPNPATRKQREIYIGNLAIGSVNADLLKELFNAALANLVPDPITNPPVHNVNMDPNGSGWRAPASAPRAAPRPAFSASHPPSPSLNATRRCAASLVPCSGPVWPLAMRAERGGALARSCHCSTAPNPRPAGRYAFVELRTEELATQAMLLDKTELAGRSMNIGRPKGSSTPLLGTALLLWLLGTALLLWRAALHSRQGSN